MADRPRTLILPPRYPEDTIALWEQAIEEGWRCQRIGMEGTR